MSTRNRKFKNTNKKFNRPIIRKKKGIDEYNFYIGTSKQASDFEVTSKFIINYIKRTFQHGNDIAESLRTLTLKDMNEWRPALKMSSANDEETAKLENRQYEIEFKASLDEYMKRTTMYKQNIYKAYAFLWEKCTRSMQNKVSSRKDFESEIFNDPVKLLTAIKEHSLNYQETRYEMAIIADSIRGFINTKQKENESLSDFTRRYKTSKDIMEAQIGGPLILKKYIKTMDEYKINNEILIDQDENPNETQNSVLQTKSEIIANEKNCIKKAANILYAYIYIENADSRKYGSVLKTLNQQKSFGNDQFPKTIIKANSILSNHNYEANKKRYNDTTDNNQEDTKNLNNNNYITPTLSFAQIELRCYCCGKKGHRSNQCKFKNTIPKDKWAIAKTKEQFAKDEENNN